MSLNGSDVATYYGRQASALGNLIERHRSLVAGLGERDKVLESQLMAARRELAATYLPGLSDADLLRVAKLTGFQGFARRDPRAAIAHERKVLAATIAGIENDEKFARRDVLVGPAGTLTQELDTARETLAPLQAECERFESLVGFKELLDIGYDTPRFAEKWWHATYWKHWAAGDRICKALGLNDFGDDVIPAYNKCAEPRNFMAGEVARIENQINAVHELVRERDRLIDRQAHLDEIYLAEAQDFLGEHLANADAALLEQWAEADPDLVRPVQMGVRTIAGLTAKRAFLQEIASAGVPPIVNQLDLRRRKCLAKAQKFARPKHAYASFPSSMINDGFETKSKAMADQVDKLEKRVDRLVAAENYAGFDLRNDQALWWMYLMNQPPPRYAPHLHGYYQQRPDITPIVDPDFVDMSEPAEAAVATAYAAGEQEQEGYLS